MKMKFTNPVARKVVINLLAITIILFILVIKSNCQKIDQLYGITLCGAEFGEKKLPGVYNVDYTYPSSTDINYFASKGVDIIQLPIKWERIQRTLGGNLHTEELNRIYSFVDECALYNIKVIIVLQNFGRYTIQNTEHIVGGPVASSQIFKDFWRKMAVAFFNKPNIHGFAIMSEPHDMLPYKWAHSAQQAINGIREIDRSSIIFVDGDNYSNPYTWGLYNDDLKYLKDPCNKIVFNAHCYFDNDYSGRYKQSFEKDGANEWIGVERVRPFVNWLKINHKQGYVGEFGIPKNDEQWAKTLDHFLEYLQMTGLGGSYWAAGNWWKDYALSIQPLNNQDQSQMKILAKVFKKSTTSMSDVAVAQ